MSTTELPWLPQDEAASWQRVRRYAVPRSMIELATERRLAGDWRGACAAANVDVAFDLAEVAARAGREVAEAIEEDLTHFAPDLLRWHLPRYLGGRTTLAPRRTITLAGYGPDVLLQVRTPPMVDGPQRIVLRVHGNAKGARARDSYGSGDARALWDARRVDGLRRLCGGGARLPFFHGDGTPLRPDELPGVRPPRPAGAGGPGRPTAAGGADPATWAEWVIGLLDGDRVVEAFDAVGIQPADWNPELPSWRGRRQPLALLRRLPLALTRIPAAVREVCAATGAGSVRILLSWQVGLHLSPDEEGVVWAWFTDARKDRDATPLPDVLWRRLPDFDLLRTGRLDPDRLHPLVRAAFFPDRAAAVGPVGPPEPALPEPVRVRCRGEWHEVQSRDGELGIPHTEAEVRREQALRAFGGKSAGCFAVRQAWRESDGRLPRRLRAQRQEFFSLVQQGDTRGVLRLLDAGVDPRLRNGRRQTLLHLLHLVDHEPLLPRLLKAGLDLEARDHHDRTPLHIAVGDNGSPALVEALLAAGARVDVVDHSDWSVRDLIRVRKRKDLPFLAERLEGREDLDNHDWWDEDVDEDEEDE
ncbi:ankyrin repeat domain-containing protein [Micromonospora sp. NPDC049559]|uniref:ankyrin repeat domain-containing protein n=1 Tax=Micromonospora sp. NPDC049559 TaxID=3155923 RepID=UPI00342D2E17